MSSYLSFYLVPNKTKTKYGYDEEKGHTEEVIEVSKGEPLLLMTYSRSDDIYQAYNDTLHPAYAGNEDKYTELTYEDAKRVIDEFENDLKKTEKRLAVSYKMLKERYDGELWTDIQSTEEYLDEQRATLEELKHISNLVYECTNKWTDFEKVLINID